MSFRRISVLAGALALATLLMSEAHAGKKDSKGKADPPTIEMTGLKSFDKVFSEFQDIDTKIGNAEQAMKVAKRKLNEALELEKGTPLKDGIADLKTQADGKVKVAMKGKQPTLAASDAVPENVSNAIDAVNAMTEQLTTAIEELATVPEDIKRLSEASADFPSSLKDELSKSGAKVTEAPKILKTLKGNVAATGQLPERSGKVATRAGNMVKMVAETFPSDEGAAPTDEAEGTEDAPAAE
jgi:hypothetical protein